jgi:putative redox protein
MTIALYARRKRWPLDEVAVRLRHSRVHAEDCANCETKEGMLSVIEREISLSGQLSEDQRSQLRTIADRCPVHRTLTSKIEIRTRLT